MEEHDGYTIEIPMLAVGTEPIICDKLSTKYEVKVSDVKDY